MTTFNTGNPPGSTAPEDLYDNAENFDNLMLGDQLKYPDRLNKERLSWKNVEVSVSSVIEESQQAIEEIQSNAELQINNLTHSAVLSQSAVAAAAQSAIQDINSTVTAAGQSAEVVLAGLGYLVPVDFSTGLSVDSSRFTVTYNGNTYAALADKVPFVTTGTFDPTQWRLVAGVMDGDVMTIVDASGTVVHVLPGPSGDSAIDTARLQAALDKTGTVSCLNPGTYYYNAASTIRSNTRLVIGEGARWQKDINSDWSEFLINEAYSNAHKPVTSMTRTVMPTDPWKDNVSPSVAKAYLTIVCPSHGFNAGEYAAFYGAVEYGLDGVMKVVSVSDGNTFIAECHSLPTVTTATPDINWANGLFCFKSDVNIHIDIFGELDGMCNAMVKPLPPAGSIAKYLMGIVIRGVMVGSLNIHLIRRMRKYTAIIANVRNFNVPYANIDNYSDGLHFLPPYVGVQIGFAGGATGDDIVSLTGGDFVSYEISRGHGYDIRIDKIACQNAMVALKVTGNAPFKFWDIEIGSVIGTTQYSAIKVIRDANLQSTSIGRLNIDVLDVAVQYGLDMQIDPDEMDSFHVGEYRVNTGYSSENFGISVSNNNDFTTKIGRMSIGKISTAVAGAGNRRFIQLGRGVSINELDLDFSGYNIASSSSAFFGVYMNGPGSAIAPSSVRKLRMRGNLVLASGSGFPIYQGGRIGVVDVSELDITGGNALVYQLPTAEVHDGFTEARVIVGGLVSKNMSRLVNVIVNTRIVGSEALIGTVAGNAPVFCASGSSLYVDGHINTVEPSAIAIADNTVKIYGNSRKLKCDAARLKNQASVGTEVYNTNSASAKVGPNIYDGTNWIHTVLDYVYSSPTNALIGSKATGDFSIEVGSQTAVNALSYIDMHGGSSATDYDVRFSCGGGNGSPGQGALNVYGKTLTLNATDYVILAGSVNFTAQANTRFVMPVTGATYDIGSSVLPYRDIYSQNAAIVVSDENHKEEIQDIPEELLEAWGKINFQMWKMKAAVAEKGDEARWHMGLIAQQVRDVLIAEGLDWKQYGLITYEQWSSKPAVKDSHGNEVIPAKAAGEIYMLRMDECLAIEAAYQRRCLRKIEEAVAALR